MLQKDKVVFITGASSGIGKALAIEFVREGAKVVLASRNLEQLKIIEQQLGNQNCCCVQMDMEQSQGFQACVEQALARFGRIDILVNNAGVSQRSLVAETRIEVDRRMMEINYFGAIALTKLILPLMIKQGGGNICVISSAAGKYGFWLRSAYSASKHALHGFFESLQIELKASNIKVTMVCPGGVATNISVNALSGDGKSHGKMDNLQNKGLKPEYVAQKIVKAIAKGKFELYLGGGEIFLIYLKRYFPALFRYVAVKVGPR